MHDTIHASSSEWYHVFLHVISVSYHRAPSPDRFPPKSWHAIQNPLWIGCHCPMKLAIKLTRLAKEIVEREYLVPLPRPATPTWDNTMRIHWKFLSRYFGMRWFLKHVETNDFTVFMGDGTIATYVLFLLSRMRIYQHSAVAYQKHMAFKKCAQTNPLALLRKARQ